MYVTSVATASPPQRYSKLECWEAFRSSPWFNRLSRRAHTVAETVLLRDNGIAFRHLAVEDLRDVFQIDPDTLYQRFVRHAPALAAQAGSKALLTAGLAPRQIDAVVVSTCTGYLCPGLSCYVVEQLGLRADVQAYDLVGQGCAAALPNLRMGDALLSTGTCRHVLSICVEVCSAAMYLDDDPGVMISACLFGDGAGAAVLSQQPVPGRRRIQWCACSSLTEPSQREALRFEERQGLLRNILTREVPQLASVYAHRVLQQVLSEAGVARSEIRAWILHAGGRDVLQAIEKTFEVAPGSFSYSETVLREHGNLSSAFVYFVLQAALDEEAESGWWWLSSFGAGFSCHGALLKVE